MQPVAGVGRRRAEEARAWRCSGTDVLSLPQRTELDIDWNGGDAISLAT
jgi:hypothetical protein